jgi:hypothetical protein
MVWPGVTRLDAVRYCVARQGVARTQENGIQLGSSPNLLFAPTWGLGSGSDWRGMAWLDLVRYVRGTVRRVQAWSAHEVGAQ